MSISTAGIIIFGILSLIHFREFVKFKWSSITMVLVLVLGIYFLMNNEVFSEKLFGKLDSSNEDWSAVARLMSVIVPLSISIAHPLFGCGVKGFEVEYVSYSQQLFHISSDPFGSATNTVLNMAAIFGMWFGIWALFEMYSFVKKYKSGVFEYLLLFLALILIFSNENVMYNIILYIIIFYGHRKLANKRNIGNRINSVQQA
jgi:hypothetical protein